MQRTYGMHMVGVVTITIAAAVLALALAPQASAAITSGGDAGEISPAGPRGWTSTTDGFIGLHAGKTGSVTVDNGSKLLNEVASLGYYSGSTGLATVTGAGSTWTTTASFAVGTLGKGSLTVDNGGVVNTGTLYASPDDLKGNGTINANGLVTDMDLVFDANQGVRQTLSFGDGGTLNLSVSDLTFWGNAVGAGYRGTGSITIKEGATVTAAGELGFLPGSCGTAAVRGAGSTWIMHFPWFNIGDGGTGALRIEAGGKILSTSAVYLGYLAGSSGTATVTGAGSTWTAGSLRVGSSGTGILMIADGGEVTSTDVSVFSTSAVNLRVNGTGMVVLGTASTVGSVKNNGQINFYADAFLTAGAYSPITEYSSRPITWSGTGTYNAMGGTLDDAKTFTVAAATSLDAGVSDDVSTGERLLVTDLATGKRMGASFGTVGDAVNFSAELIDPSELSGLVLTDGESVRSAWDFTTNFTGGTALLAFDIGKGASGLKVWHNDGGTWATYAASDLIYDGNGIASFTVSDVGDFAITAVPEPATLGLLALGGLSMIRRKRGH